jgi:hypothetical protein
MILNDEQIKETMESPLNLLNRLKNASSHHKDSIIPSLPPTADELIDNLEDKIGASGSLKSKAASIMKSCMTELEKRLPEVQKPERLASIAAEMSKVVHASTNDDKNSNKGAQIVIYAPIFRSEEQFDVITVNE